LENIQTFRYISINRTLLWCVSLTALWTVAALGVHPWGVLFVLRVLMMCITSFSFAN